MDIAALILDPLEKAAVLHLLGAIRQTAVDPALRLDPLNLRVAFSFHPELGSRLIIHVDSRQSEAEPWDPYLFFASLPGGFGAGGFGPGVSGYLVEALNASAVAPTVWTCLRERRSGAWSVHRGIMYTAEDDDCSEDDGAFRRLAGKLGVTDPDLLLSKLELPDTSWCRIDERMPVALASQLLQIAR